MDRHELEALDRIFGPKSNSQDNSTLESREEAERLIRWAKPKTTQGSGYSLGQSYQALVPICAHIACKMLQTSYCPVIKGAATACITDKEFRRAVQTVEAAMSNLHFPSQQGKEKKSSSRIASVDYTPLLELLKISIPELKWMVERMHEVEQFYLQREEFEDEEPNFDGNALRCAVVIYVLRTLKIETNGFGPSSFAKNLKVSATEIRSLLLNLRALGYDDGQMLRDFGTASSSSVRTRSAAASTSRSSSPVKINGIPVKDLLVRKANPLSPTKMSPEKKKAARLLEELHRKDPVTPSRYSLRIEEDAEDGMDVDPQPESPSKKRKVEMRSMGSLLDDDDLLGTSSHGSNVGKPMQNQTARSKIARNLFAKDDDSLPNLQKLALTTPSTSPIRRSQRASDSPYRGRAGDGGSFPQTPTRTRRQISPSKSPTKRVRMDIEVETDEEEEQKAKPIIKKTPTTLSMRQTIKRKPRAFLDHAQWCKVDPRLEKLRQASEDAWKEMTAKYGEPVF